MSSPTSPCPRPSPARGRKGKGKASGVEQTTTASETATAPETATPAASSPSLPPCDGSAHTPPPPSLRRCTDEERGAYRIISATETDATVRKHGESIILGYNAALLASANFIRSIQLFTGATPDGATVAHTVATHLAQFGFAPKRIVYDRAAGTPKHIADLRRISHGQTQLVARQINYGQRHTRFAPTDFTLGPSALTCPNGVTSTHAYRAASADGWNYRFLASECLGCPLWKQCRDPKSKPTSHRAVFISDYIHN